MDRETRGKDGDKHGQHEDSIIMTKKHFIALANAVIAANKEHPGCFSFMQICRLADYCRSQNPNFDEDLWMRYINGECGPSGGVKKPV